MPWLNPAAHLVATEDAIAVADTLDLASLLIAIAKLDHEAAVDLLNATPALTTAGLARRDEFFLAERLAQVYEGAATHCRVARDH